MRWKRRVLRGLAASSTCAAALLITTPAGHTAPTVSESKLDITMQEQEKDQWCWDASGATVADFWGHDISQTKFCQIAHDESGDDCANNQGYLSDQQAVYDYLGFSDVGTYNSDGEILNLDGIKSEIDAGQPVGTRIGYTSGAGHMHVVYGYGDSTVEYGDPWPSNERYNSMDYDAYTSNSEFQWTHTVYGVKG